MQQDIAQGFVLPSPADCLEAFVKGGDAVHYAGRLLLRQQPAAPLHEKVCILPHRQLGAGTQQPGPLGCAQHGVGPCAAAQFQPMDPGGPHLQCQAPVQTEGAGPAPHVRPGFEQEHWGHPRPLQRMGGREAREAGPHDQDARHARAQQYL